MHVCEVCGRTPSEHDELCARDNERRHWPAPCCDGCACGLTEAFYHCDDLPEEEDDRLTDH